MHKCFVRFALLLALIFPGFLQAREPQEEKRIEFLLMSVESLKGAVFIRNGSEYNACDAGKHLRLKLAKGGERVKTAEDFIKACASHSEMSGAAYKIRFADGTVTETAPFFLNKLEEFDKVQKKDASISVRDQPLSQTIVAASCGGGSFGLQSVASSFRSSVSNGATGE